MLDWVATGIGLLGCGLLGSDHRIGWLCYAIASGINGYLGFTAGFLGMGIGAVCYCILELRAYIKSHRKKKEVEYIDWRVRPEDMYEIQSVKLQLWYKHMRGQPMTEEEIEEYGKLTGMIK